MSEFASNCPVSRPVKLTGVTPDADFGGLMWNNEHGFIYYPDQDFMPIRPPSP